jgi:sulfatase maturation enzyme AslB (radical SAM superfamily)
MNSEEETGAGHGFHVMSKPSGAICNLDCKYVDRISDVPSQDQRRPHAPPPAARNREGYPVAPWSVLPEDYGEFLVAIFAEWVRKDVGKIFVQLFDVSLGIWMGYPAGLCIFRERCGDAVALEYEWRSLFMRPLRVP